MVSYNILFLLYNLLSFPLTTIPQPRQQVFPFFGTLQLLPSSHTSLKWYLFPKTAIQFSKYGLPASDRLPASRRWLAAPFIVPILPPSKPIVNDFSILHLLYIYRYSVIYPPHIYNSMMSTYGVQFQAFCITSFYVISLYGVFGGSMGFYIPKSKNAVQRKFDGLVTNSFFVIVATLIITFSI